jgi:hypothetical protein
MERRSSSQLLGSAIMQREIRLTSAVRPVLAGQAERRL